MDAEGQAGNGPGAWFYDEATKTFFEVEQQAVDTGNNAWAAIALRALYLQTGRAAYLDTACKLGNFIQAFRNDVGTFRIHRRGRRSGGHAAASGVGHSEHNLDTLRCSRGCSRSPVNRAGYSMPSTPASSWRRCGSRGTIAISPGTTDPNTRNSEPVAFRWMSAGASCLC